MGLIRPADVLELPKRPQCLVILGVSIYPKLRVLLVVTWARV